MLHPAANRHPEATHQWLLMGVQACRLPALKPLKRSKRSKPLKQVVDVQLDVDTFGKLVSLCFI